MTLRHQINDLRALIFANPDPTPEGPAGRFAQAALERHKREGMELAFRARLVTLAIFAVMLPLVGSIREAIYYEILLVLLAVIGWLQRRVARVGTSWLELLLVYADVLVMTVAILAPNPLQPVEWPASMEFRSEAFKYFFVFLAFGTLAYSWRTVRGIGNMIAVTWLAAIVIIWLISTPDPDLSAAAAAAFGHSQVMLDHLDPNSLLAWIRAQEIVVVVVVAWVLSVTVRRFSRLVMEQADLERERANLARYFSPNVVDELSQNDEPLKQIRTQNIAVLFVDIVGFTQYAAERTPEEVIVTLRQFHQRMEEQVFGHNGTLDKYLGDGLMATFGTPVASDKDALNALRCARAMLQSVAEWNSERRSRGEIPIKASFGLHYGPAVLGDIGANRLEFAVIGNTVNVASRVEALTRKLSVELAATDDLINAVRHQSGSAEFQDASDMVRHEDQTVKGLESGITVWTMKRPSLKASRRHAPFLH